MTAGTPVGAPSRNEPHRLIGLQVLPRPQAAPILAWLDNCFELCGTPLELMSANGSPFVVWMPGVLTLCGKTLGNLAYPAIGSGGESRHGHRTLRTGG